jgi:predicted Fe-Mo cluster-binding NifX family protein
MRIAVAANGHTLDAPADPRFDHCPSFLIADTDSGAFISIENPDARAGNGSGTGAAQAVAAAGVEVAIAASFGHEAARGLIAAGIAPYTGRGETVADLLEAFEAGVLEWVPGPTVGDTPSSLADRSAL